MLDLTLQTQHQCICSSQAVHFCQLVLKLGKELDFHLMKQKPTYFRVLHLHKCTQNTYRHISTAHLCDFDVNYIGFNDVSCENP